MFKKKQKPIDLGVKIESKTLADWRAVLEKTNSVIEDQRLTLEINEVIKEYAAGKIAEEKLRLKEK